LFFSVGFEIIKFSSGFVFLTGSNFLGLALEFVMSLKNVSERYDLLFITIQSALFKQFSNTSTVE